MNTINVSYDDLLKQALSIKNLKVRRIALNFLEAGKSHFEGLKKAREKMLNSHTVKMFQVDPKLN